MTNKYTKKTLKELVIELPELYQLIYKHKELSKSPSRDSEDRLDNLIKICEALSLKVQRRLRVLDLGCAQGFFSMSLSEAGAIVHGVDFAEENIAVCKKLAEENKNLDVSFQLGNIQEFISQLETAEYDLVLGLSVFHHIIHEHGVSSVLEILDHLSSKVESGVFEFAQDVQSKLLIDCFVFVVVVIRVHVSQEKGEVVLSEFFFKRGGLMSVLRIFVCVCVCVIG